jgi:hypothetical protein
LWKAAAGNGPNVRRPACIMAFLPRPIEAFHC